MHLHYQLNYSGEKTCLISTWHINISPALTCTKFFVWTRMHILPIKFVLYKLTALIKQEQQLIKTYIYLDFYEKNIKGHLFTKEVHFGIPYPLTYEILVIIATHLRGFWKIIFCLEMYELNICQFWVLGLPNTDIVNFKFYKYIIWSKLNKVSVVDAFPLFICRTRLKAIPHCVLWKTVNYVLIL